MGDRGIVCEDGQLMAFEGLEPAPHGQEHRVHSFEV